jgi:alkylhydroperoxidase/carboxymuconolactone decarboxylase family protein YurZ
MKTDPDDKRMGRSITIDERMQRGIRLLEQMLGADQAQQVRESWRNISADFEQYVLEFLAGEIWSRPQLDLRTKSLVTIAALAALGRTRGLELNIRMARQNGASRQDVTETLLHIAPYAGFPAAWEGLELVDKIYADPGSRPNDQSEAQE